MLGIRVLCAFTLWNAAALIAADTPHYIISTYAGGAPAPPTAALSLSADGRGNVYFVDGLGFAGPARSNSVFRIDASGSITRIAGNSRTGFSGDGGPGASASLNYPLAAAADRAGNVFIVDAGNQRVRRVSLDGTITTVAGGGSAVLGDGGPALSGQLNYPSSIAVDGAGNLFIGELGRVRKVTPDGIITTVAGGGPNSPVDGALATTVSLTNAIGVAVDGAGNLFIADQDVNDDSFNFFIRKVAPDGTISTLPPAANCCYANIAADNAGNLLLSTGSSILRISPGGSKTVIAGNGTYGPPSGDGQPATQAQLNGAGEIAVDSAGDLFIADNGGRNIRVVTPDGIIRAFASIAASAPLPSGDHGPAVMANLQLAFPGLTNQGGLTVDSAGNLYIAETGAHRVRKVAPDGTITTVAGIGGPRCTGPSTCLPLGDGGPATAAALSYPTGVAVDGAGNLFIADSGNSRVRKVTPQGTISTYAGNGNAPRFPRGTDDGGPAINAPLFVLGVAVDSAGNLLISEGSYADVRKVSPDGTITTLLSPTGRAFLGFISAMTVDRAGNLFVAGSVCDSDTCDYALRKISPSGETTLLAGGRNAFNGQPGGGIGDGAPASGAAIGFISSLAVDNAGNLFLTDLFEQRVRKIDANGIITTVGGDGIPGYSGDGGAATSASVYYPLGLALDSGGNLYVSDFNQAVRILRPSAQ
jgi:sugar lactone lactonase YvrE